VYSAKLPLAVRFGRAIAKLDQAIRMQPDSAAPYQARGELYFRAGHFSASIIDFDRFLELRPDREPHHWQRGISYYYAGEFAKGVRQFELHRTVNPQDVENAVWHYLCKARLDGVDAARKALFPISGDRRPWATAVYRMFQGGMSPGDVVTHVGQIGGTDADRRNNLFYAHLYVGLFHEAAGKSDEARKHIKIAVEKYPSTHYMGDVARVHLELGEFTAARRPPSTH
jgi:lipoprotein NlpI